jgi:hypothetical protein
MQIKTADTLLCARLLFCKNCYEIFRNLLAATASAAIVTATAAAIICADTISATATADEKKYDYNPPAIISATPHK